MTFACGCSCETSTCFFSAALTSATVIFAIASIVYYLVGFGIAVSLRMALDHIADIAVEFAIELHRGEHLGQELPGAADEWLALLVLFLARPLADDDQLGLRIARAEDHRLAALAELAERASLPRPLLRRER